jgi:hypothetical protein
MRPTVEQICEAITKEAARHGLMQESVCVDIPSAIEIPGRPRSYDHIIDCRCGHKYELRTQHSGTTQAGRVEFHQALQVKVLEHAVISCAAMIYELHRPKQ